MPRCQLQQRPPCRVDDISRIVTLDKFVILRMPDEMKTFFYGAVASADGYAMEVPVIIAASINDLCHW